MATSLLAASFKDCINLKTFIKISADKLPHCGGDEWSGFNRCGGLLRSDVVWFGETIPLLMGEIARKITWCESPDRSWDFFYSKFLDFLLLLIFFDGTGFNLRQILPEIIRPSSGPYVS